MDQYLEKLRKYLSKYNSEDAESALEFYTDYLTDGPFSTYEDCVNDLGTPKFLTRKIMAEYSIKKNKDSKKSRENMKTIWLVILGICSTPITIPLAVMFFVFFVIMPLVVFISVFAVLLSVFLSGIAFIIGGLRFDLQTILMFIGAGLVAISVSTMLFCGLFWISSKTITGIKKLCIWAYGKIGKRKGDK
ncbi:MULTISPECIES: DUF1700 domain-containing protein [Apilactobacillus]|uniref:DUF1700 domain-containing protein n=1 Tax=Apilactobacillus timberlakei TaxID=2008380 RepID=A0ABY2YUE9_9LACO|nr:MULTISPECIES: DUF1700 domain-containing protein [Apilactobacillus]TPR13153.1 DUF1700 domain-containing protein [Apilactobacillus timberlakei]TPR14203.1 DUF1700 domain-containing protein [Apilactobacillus timberlakei]TPR16456.1 DUF1700 domain-containing protein [Apilactobacillus timberlakei]TPR19147.1 DUF1700 domain-containing protein [Apilactobacillus timberlakei]TPR23342.1 DUF1700 domain-containing protein [Apilactobacillus timberlakei]